MHTVATVPAGRPSSTRASHGPRKVGGTLFTVIRVTVMGTVALRLGTSASETTTVKL